MPTCDGGTVGEHLGGFLGVLPPDSYFSAGTDCHKQIAFPKLKHATVCREDGACAYASRALAQILLPPLGVLLIEGQLTHDNPLTTPPPPQQQVQVQGQEQKLPQRPQDIFGAAAAQGRDRGL